MYITCNIKSQAALPEERERERETRKRRLHSNLMLLIRLGWWLKWLSITPYWWYVRITWSLLVALQHIWIRCTIHKSNASSSIRMRLINGWVKNIIDLCKQGQCFDFFFSSGSTKTYLFPTCWACWRVYRGSNGSRRAWGKKEGVRGMFNG